VPIFDRVINNWLALKSGGSWKTMRVLLTDHRHTELRRLAVQAETMGAEGVTQVPDLRLFDSLIWMLHSDGAEQTRAALSSGADPEVSLGV
jgi:hypothetical protein